MKLSAPLRTLSERLGHEFRDPSLLVRALTHGSRGSGEGDNQRLEFLGDRVLGLVVAQALLEADPAADEGRIAPRFNALVRRETCAEVARAVDLGAGLKLGRSEMIGGGRRKEALLADEPFDDHPPLELHPPLDDQPPLDDGWPGLPG